MIFKTVLGVYSKNYITLKDEVKLKAYPFSPDIQKIEGNKGFFLLRSRHGWEDEIPIVIENYVLLSDSEFEEFK